MKPTALRLYWDESFWKLSMCVRVLLAWIETAQHPTWSTPFSWTKWKTVLPQVEPRGTCPSSLLTAREGLRISAAASCWTAPWLSPAPFPCLACVLFKYYCKMIFLLFFFPWSWRCFKEMLARQWIKFSSGSDQIPPCFRAWAAQLGTLVGFPAGKMGAIFGEASLERLYENVCAANTECDLVLIF